jgi:hypothetical protein
MKAMINKVPMYEIAGVNVTITCQCNGYVIMEWLRDGHKVPTMIDATFSTGIFNITRKIIQIKNFSKTDEGKYECRLKYSKYNWTHFNTVNISMEGKVGQIHCKSQRTNLLKVRRNKILIFD